MLCTILQRHVLFTMTYRPLAVQKIAQVYLGGGVHTPADATEARANVLVRLDGNGLLECLTATLEYTQVTPPVITDPFADGHSSFHNKQFAQTGVDGKARLGWKRESERTEFPMNTIVRTSVCCQQLAINMHEDSLDHGNACGVA